MTSSVAIKVLPDDVRRGTFFERNVPVSSMFVHYRSEPNGYARPLNKRRVDRLVAEWDAQAVGILLLSMRNDGRFAIIDGQHRVNAGAIKGTTTFDAYVYIDLTLQDEARLYRKFGDYLKQTARDRFFAAIAEREPEALAIERILATRGLRVVPGGSPKNGIAAVEAVLNVARHYGPQTFRDTIDLLHDAWGGEPLAYLGPVIRGTAAFLARYKAHTNYRRERLVKRMARLGTSGVEQQSLHVYALEKGEKGSAWGKALRAVHDTHVTAQWQLPQWPDTVLTERGVESLRLSAAKGWETRKARSNQVQQP